MRFRLIDAAKKDFPVARLCKVLDVSPSGYFAWKNRSASTRQREDLVLLAHVRSAFTLSHETYGSPRMTHELREQGLAAGRRRVARLMRENGLKARQPRRFRRTTDSGHAFPVAPNHLDQDFTAAGPDRKWGADISYVWTREGWLYRAGCTGLAVPGGGPRSVLPTGRGLGGGRSPSQGTCTGCVATCPLVWRTAFQTRAEAIAALARYIDGFYNPRRRHSALGFTSPTQFERGIAHQTALH